MNVDALSCVEIERRFQALNDVHSVHVSGDGYRYNVLVVSGRFDGQSLLARQRWVYSHLSDWITSGRLHAVTMQTMTPSEQENQHG